MKLFAFAGLIAVTLSESIWEQTGIRNFDSIDHYAAFEDWMNAFDKTYSDEYEKAHRYSVFMDNWVMINDHNLNPTYNWTMGHNQFSDLTVTEFQYEIHGHLNPCKKSDNSLKDEILIDTPKDITKKATAPTSIDWTNVNGSSWVTPVKNQGQCGRWYVYFIYIHIIRKIAHKLIIYILGIFNNRFIRITCSNS